MIIGYNIAFSHADECGKLPDIENLQTTFKFPVGYDTPVKVECDVGYSLEGWDVITCIRGDTFQSGHGPLPSCTASESIIPMKKVWIILLHK